MTTTPPDARTGIRSYPFGDAAGLEPYPLYARLRREEPICRVRMPYGEEAWLVTRYADVRTVLGDPRFSRALGAGRDQPRMSPRASGNGLFALDPPDHTRLRALAAPAFTARNVQRLRPRVQRLTDDLVDGMLAVGPPADFIPALVAPLVMSVICDLFAVPPEDREQFRVWSQAVLSTSGLPPGTVQEYIANMIGYMTGLIEARRRTPGDDVLSLMLEAQREPGCPVTEAQMIQLATSLLSAGHETTMTQLPNCVYTLLTERTRWRALLDRPDLVPAAVEELMRYIPLGVASLFARYATQDVELSGVLVRAGEPVLAAVYSANRDESAFPEADRLDFDREQRPNFAFGFGAHYCLGAPLVRMELAVVLGTLLRRVPNLRLAVPEDELRWKAGIALRGPVELPLTW